MSKRRHPETRYHKRLFDNNQPYSHKVEDNKKGKGSYKRDNKLSTTDVVTEEQQEEDTKDE